MISHTYGRKIVKKADEIENMNNKNMSKDDVYKKLLPFIGQSIKTEIDEVTLSSNLKIDLGFDSLSEVLLLQVIEDLFNLKIDDDEFDNFSTVGDVVDYIFNNLK